MLCTFPITRYEANAFITKHHRHHRPTLGAKFVIGLSNGARLVGVAVVGRPVARELDDGWTLEVNRTCTTGEHNANSMLYGAAWKVARALGYCRLVTYTLPSESGSSLRAVGFELVGSAGGGSWSREKRPRVGEDWPLERKQRWQKKCAKPAIRHQPISEREIIRREKQHEPDLFRNLQRRKALT